MADNKQPPAQPAAPKTVPELLRAAAATYEERSKVYGDNYKHFGKVMVGCFPRGVTLQTEDDWIRMGLFIQLASKVTRYAQSFETGHIDSAHDSIVYAAMLEEMTTK